VGGSGVTRGAAAVGGATALGWKQPGIDVRRSHLLLMRLPACH
jgi:hypothetical protein